MSWTTNNNLSKVWKLQAELVDQLNSLTQGVDSYAVEKIETDFRKSSNGCPLKFNPEQNYIAIVSPSELNNRHGVGVYMNRLFTRFDNIISVRSMTQYPGEETMLGDHIYCIYHNDDHRPSVFLKTLHSLGNPNIDKVICIPWSPSDVLTALAIKECFNSKLCTYIMDDQNIHCENISDELMAELLSASDLRLAISNEMREAYSSKFDVRIGFMPPVVDKKNINSSGVAKTHNYSGNGIILGNIWGKLWLRDLRNTLIESGIKLDWYSNDYSRWWHSDTSRVNCNERPEDESALVEDGLIIPGEEALGDEQLIKLIRRSPFTVVPTGNMEDGDVHNFIAKLSLPSRIPYILATSNTPIIVMGSKSSAAAQFVERYGLGICVAYDANEFSKAVSWLQNAEVAKAIRINAQSLASYFSDEGATSWLFDSLALGHPVDNRYEKILSHNPVEVLPDFH